MSNIKKLKDDLYFVIDKLAMLTQTEKSILAMLIENKKPKKIAEDKHIELSTVKFHIGNILKKLNVKKTKEAILIIRRMNLEKFFDRV
jgi:DNA-binding NarL/FixJ family response regulator